MPARMGAAKPPMLLEAVQKPQKVPRSLSGYHAVRMRAHAGAPRPCGHFRFSTVALIHHAPRVTLHPAQSAGKMLINMANRLLTCDGAEVNPHGATSVNMACLCVCTGGRQGPAGGH